MGRSWRRARTASQMKSRVRQGFVKGSSCVDVEFAVDSLSLFSEAFLRLTFRAASRGDPHVTVKEAIASVFATGFCILDRIDSDKEM